MLRRDWRGDFRLATSPLRCVPDFIIAGEAKCGTTSLYRYLTQHPDIFGADRKEPNNFIDFPASLAHCRAHFPLRVRRWFRKRIRRRAFLTGEASAEYFSRRGVAERIARLLPDVRIIVLLRDPARRALSDYAMLEKAGILKDSFASLVARSMTWLADAELARVLQDAGQYEHSEIRVVLRGIYVDNLLRWKNLFPPDRFCVVISEDLYAHPQQECDRLFAFLGLPAHRLADVRAYREGEHDLRQHQEALGRLARFYAPHNEHLYQALGRRCDWPTE